MTHDDNDVDGSEKAEPDDRTIIGGTNCRKWCPFVCYSETIYAVVQGQRLCLCMIRGNAIQDLDESQRVRVSHLHKCGRLTRHATSSRGFLAVHDAF